MMTDSNPITVEPSILTREFNAPRQLVYDAWTQVDHLKNWMFPMAGVVCEYIQADITADGTSLHKMTMPNGFEMWLLTRYHELNPPGSLVFTQYNSNEAGEILPNPFMPDWPEELVTTINLEEVDGKTRLELIWQPINPNRTEADAFEASRDQHGNGWGGGFDQLTIYLDDR